MIDSRLLPPGCIDFNLLNPVVIIMIMPFDLFGYELYRYTFQMQCEEVPELELGDDATRIFLNSHGKHPELVSQELIELLELEKSLVYFTTSLRSNEVVLEKLLRTERVKKYPEDEDLLEDVIIENKQAIEMANIYSGILSGMMDAFASVISNNLNIVMKFLATVTIVLSIPTMIASFFGMNFDNIPLGHSPFGFFTIIILTLIISGVVALLFRKKDLF